MNILGQSRRIAKEFLLTSGDSIKEVRASRSGAVVETEESTWHVELGPVQVVSEPDQPAPWTVYEATMELFSEPGQSPAGFAVLADGAILSLGRKPDLDRFWRVARTSLGPADVAALIIRYQTSPPRHIMSDAAELDRVVGKSIADKLAPTTTQQSTLDSDGAVTELQFSTWHIATHRTAHPDTVTVELWKVVASPSGLTWTSTLLADNLKWMIGS